MRHSNIRVDIKRYVRTSRDTLTAMLKTIVDAYLVQIYTKDFRLAGLIHLPKNIGTEQHLNNNNYPYLAVTEATVYPSGYEFQGQKQPQGSSADFLAVPKERILSITGGKLSTEQPLQRNLETRRFCLLFADFLLRGDFLLPSSIRLSDYLKGQGNRTFHTLRNAELAVPLQGVALADTPEAESFDFITVNFRSAGSIADMMSEVEEQKKVFT